MSDDIILEFNKKDKTGLIKKNQKIIKVKSIKICNVCYIPKKSKDLMKCTSKGCDIYICKNCATFIGGLPYCPECVVDFVKHKALLIVEK